MKVTTKDILIALVVTIAAGAVAFYLLLPAVNIHDKTFVGMVAILLFLFALICYVRGGWRAGMALFADGFHLGIAEGAAIVGAVILLLATVVGGIGSTKILWAAKYQKLLAVEEGSFTEDVSQAHFDNIPMLDLNSAVKLGDRKMGELVDMVSQFEVASDYAQINYQGEPVRVTPLEYGDLIKWFNNQKEGLPAYIIINMVTQEVTVQRLTEGMKYSFSDHFGRYLPRQLRFKYPTFLFDNPIFEVDEDGHPFWVVPRIDYTIGLYGGEDILGVVLCDAVTGDTTYYPLSEVPQWIDRAINSNLVMEQFDYYGTLKHGFWNSIFGQRDSLQTTSGYNYIAMNDDIFLYTGVTSVGTDQSNVGFLLVNQRTKAAKYYSAPGADETSAMSSAEGQVQNLRYNATFPLLLNIGNQPTYFMALKDDAQLVKMYAMVNVGQYQLVATGTTVLECEEAYIRLLGDHGLTDENIPGIETISAKITDIRTAVLEGNSVYYLALEGYQTMFIVPVANYNEVVTYNVGDTVELQYAPGDSMLNTIYSLEKVTEQTTVEQPVQP